MLKENEEEEKVVDTNEEDYELEIIDEEDEEKKEESKEESTTEEETSDDSYDESDVEENSDESEEETEDEELEEEKEESKEEKKVPLSALQAEREKWKARLEQEKEMADIGRRLLEGTGQTPAEIMQQLDTMEIKKLTDKGISEEEAKLSIDGKRKLSKEQLKLQKERRDLEFDKLKADKFYSDIDEYKEDIESLMESKKLSVKEAYMLIAGEKKIKEKDYQSQFAKPKKKAPKKINTVSKGDASPAKTKIRLTKLEALVAEKAGMTPKQYWESKNRNKN